MQTSPASKSRILSSRAAVAAMVVVALVSGTVIGGVLFASSSDDGGGSAAAADPTAGPGAGTSADEASGTGSGAAEGTDPLGGGSSGGGGELAELPAGQAASATGDPSEPQPLAPANPPTYAYQEEEEGRANTGTVPPQTLPVEVAMTTTSGLVDGQAITIRVTGKEGFEMYGFEARICRADAAFRGLYDFFPTVAGQCAAAPLSAGSDAYLRVENTPPYRAAEGTIHVGVGTNTFANEDGGEVTVRCDRSHPCKLVLLVQVPYGFGFQEFPLEFAA